MSGARPLAAAFVGAFAISFSALFFHYADVSALTGAFFRPAYAVPVLAFLWWRTRKQDENSARDRWIALGSGVMLAIDFVCWHLSIGHLGTGLSTLIANAQIVFVAAIAWWFLDERPDRVVLMSIPVVLVGVALVSASAGPTRSVPTRSWERCSLWPRPWPTPDSSSPTAEPTGQGAPSWGRSPMHPSGQP